MPDIRLENGSTIAVLDPTNIVRQVEGICANSDASAISSGAISTDALSETVSFEINEEYMARAREIMRSVYITESRTNIIQENNSIHRHNYMPDKFNFYKVSNEDELYMGVELEIDCGGEDNNIAKQAIDIINKRNDIIYCKHDGSLKNGFEIVSHPCTYEFHKTLAYEKMFKFLINKGYKSHDVSTCGMHVHINRDYFGNDKLTQDLCISKLLYILEKFWNKVEIIARRKSNYYARRFYLHEDESPLDLYYKSKDSAKYGVVNLQHKNSIEIRIFKGTLKYETFMNTLEFIKKVAKLAKNTDIYDIQYVTWDKLTNLFSDELNQYIEEREELRKKENKEEVTQAVSDYRSVNNDDYWYNSIGSLSGRLWRVDTLSSGINDIPETTEVHENSEEERLQRDIQNLRQKARRARNALEITNINRQIALLENELRRIRCSNR